MSQWCPECGAAYGPETVACPHCRVLLTETPPGREDEPVVIHRVPDPASGALLCGVLEQSGLRALLRSATLAGYGGVRRDWTTDAWGEILVRREDEREARSILADYLLALERGGLVRDEDVDEDASGSR